MLGKTITEVGVYFKEFPTVTKYTAPKPRSSRNI